MDSCANGSSGTYANSSQSTACALCEAGKSSPVGSSSASSCLARRRRVLDYGGFSSDFRKVPAYPKNESIRGRHLLSTTSSGSAASNIANVSSESLYKYTHWLCNRGTDTDSHGKVVNDVEYGVFGNAAEYGHCVATQYHRLDLQGLPNASSPAAPGLFMNLTVTKRDKYNQTIASDNSSSLQLYSATEKGNTTTKTTDSSVSFLGSVFSGLKKGRAD